MSYSEDVVASKLSSLNETQEAIVNIAQWVLFHRRYADQTVKTWTKALNDAPAHRKLGLIYLANEVVQQSRARRKEEFLRAFSGSIAESIENAYRQCNADLQGKIRRVVEVWRQRTIFPEEVLMDIETRLGDTDKKKPKQISGGRRIGQGLSFGLSGLPSEISKLATAHQDMTTKANSASSGISTSSKLYSEIVHAEALPAPMEYASQLERLLTSLNSAIKASNDAIKARSTFINQLESIVVANKAALEGEMNQHNDLVQKQNRVLELQQDVNQMILGRNPDESDGNEMDGDNNISSGSKVSVRNNDDNEDDSIQVPTYAPMSPDEDNDISIDRMTSKINDNDSNDNSMNNSSTVIQSSIETGASMQGLDPMVAQFLSSLVKKNSSTGNENDSNGESTSMPATTMETPEPS
ncbi:RNA polymerase II-binding domain-containing protein [Dipodascopsis uninucleata]